MLWSRGSQEACLGPLTQDRGSVLVDLGQTRAKLRMPSPFHITPTLEGKRCVKWNHQGQK